MSRSGTVWYGALLVAGLLACAPVEAKDGAPPAPDVISGQQFYGPLRSRDLTPFGYLRLDMRPAFSDDVPAGHWAVEAEIAYQNTWAISDGVEKYLETLPSRATLDADDVADIRALPGENYLVDLELAEFDLTLHRQFSPAWGAFLMLSGAHYGGGSLDAAIEEFHSVFGLSQMGRGGLARNRMNVVLDLDSVHYVSIDAPPRNGLLDPMLGVRYSGFQLPAPWKLVVEGAVKVPVAGQREFLSTGRTDVGLQASLMRRGTNHALYGSFALVGYAGSESEGQPDARVVPTLVVGLESHITRTIHSILQVYASPSIYSGDDTGLDELTSTKYQLSLGLRYHRGSHLVSFAVTENLANMSNTPDIGFQLGWAYRKKK